MRAEDLLQAIGKVEDALIEQTAKKHSTSYMRWISLAASLLLVVGLGIFAFTQLDFGNRNESIPTQTSGVLEPTSTNERTPADVGFSKWRLAMITDYGDITDGAYNQAAYEACKCFADEYDVKFRYFKPTDNNTASRVEATELAIAEGANIIVMPGYAFGATIAEVSSEYPEVMIIALDVAKGDLLEAGVALAGETYDYNPDNWNLEDYVNMRNVYCCTYREEIAGYMAGYAAVQMGYTDLGFLGGMAVPAVIRYGYGFVQGADAAAVELNADVKMKCVYGNQFFGDADITGVMDRWYADGTQAVFACGGGIFTSAAEAAMKVNGKVIGVDVDQASIIDSMYGEGMTLTSAMKGIGPSVYDALTDILINEKWEDYAGKVEALGLEENAAYLQLPLESTQWNEGFTKEEYLALLDKLTSGEIIVSDDIGAAPITTIEVEYLGNIKG